MDMILDLSKHRIAYALYYPQTLSASPTLSEKINSPAIKITPEEYDISMKGRILCPSCYTPLTRSPESKFITTNKITPHFKHIPTYKDIPCKLKSKRGQALNYTSEEEAYKAVENQDLVIVRGFMESPPEIKDENDSTPFSKVSIHDPNAPQTDIPISKHTGKTLKLPSIITSVTSICRNFDENLHRGFFFPHQTYPHILSDILINSSTYNFPEKGETTGLFWGRIRLYNQLTKRNVIFIDRGSKSDIKLYTWPLNDIRKGINLFNDDQIIIFYGSIYRENTSYYRAFLDDWGSYSLLPEKYSKYLVGM